MIQFMESGKLFKIMAQHLIMVLYEKLLLLMDEIAESDDLSLAEFDVKTIKMWTNYDQRRGTFPRLVR